MEKNTWKIPIATLVAHMKMKFGANGKMARVIPLNIKHTTMIHFELTLLNIGGARIEPRVRPK